MIALKEYAKRRLTMMKAMRPNSIGILLAAPHYVRTYETEFPYRQDSDFHYATGFAEPNAIAVFIPGRAEGEFVLFNQVKVPEKETWTGKIIGQEAACELYGADQAFAIGDFQKIFPGLLKGREHLYYAFGEQPDFNRKLMDFIMQLRMQVRVGTAAPTEIINIQTIIHEMRVIKSASEIELMAKANDISSIAHTKAMQVCKPGMYEYEIEAEITYHCIRQGNRYHAYCPIVASGANACTLHYNANDEQMRDGDLILVDAGGEFHGYASDITRCYPVNGRYSAEQRAIYEAVLDVQLQCLDFVKPGVSRDDLERLSVKCISERLLDLGLLKGSLDSVIESKAYFQFYMHKVGHWIGLDVHDRGAYKPDGKWRLFEPGIALTVEPGIYIPPGTESVDEKWWGIGVRIEDDVVVTKEGHRNLTSTPKTVDDIEALMRG
jgi:Xaa-Pro aminopeptidase